MTQPSSGSVYRTYLVYFWKVSHSATNISCSSGGGVRGELGGHADATGRVLRFGGHCESVRVVNFVSVERNLVAFDVTVVASNRMFDSSSGPLLGLGPLSESWPRPWVVGTFMLYICTQC